MNEKNIRLVTAESVRAGHPDKFCDQVADAILDAHLRQDPNARVAVEAFATAGKMIIGGEVTSKVEVDCGRIVADAIDRIGYTMCDLCEDSHDPLELEIRIHDQSEDIAKAVGRRGNGDIALGAGDQGIVYGYATNETKHMLPLPVVLAHRITRLLTAARRLGTVPGLLPDGKAQVSVEYAYGVPCRASCIVLSAQHMEDVHIPSFRRRLMEHVVVPALAKLSFDEKDVLINPSGRFVLGGFEADTGLTGRKLMADTYGGIVPHGGGALSGKDATKVDRSAAYMARYIAKNIVGARLAKECTVSLAYAIGKAEPVAVNVDTHDTGIYHDEILKEAVTSVFDLTPSGIIRTLGLTKPIFAPAACYGHFTDDTFPWEQINRAHELRIVCNAIESEKKHDQR